MEYPVTLPPRALLRPGVLVTRRDDGHLQVGLDPALAVITPDLPETRAFLRGLAQGTCPGMSVPVLRLAADLIERNIGRVCAERIIELVAEGLNHQHQVGNP